MPGFSSGTLRLSEMVGMVVQLSTSVADNISPRLVKRWDGMMRSGCEVVSALPKGSDVVCVVGDVQRSAHASLQSAMFGRPLTKRSTKHGPKDDHNIGGAKPAVAVAMRESHGLVTLSGSI